ncbi:FkbM family methyltransferase [Rhodopirellula rubra]|uniref:FkbM family methyltransferase n=2 Tax=Aporhodopirellula rubra TaxID=980271 RepID=A0A7W5DZ15_9BACT|nr:FkbM family methyltransferase [Aporhodopirellula rubra]
MRRLIDNLYLVRQFSRAINESGFRHPFARHEVLRIAHRCTCEESLKRELLRAALANGSRSFEELEMLLTLDRLWVVFNEIFVDQEYQIPATFPKAPRILDCGANVGFATEFFKTKRPDASIIAFEPTPKLADSVRDMVQRRNWDSIFVETAAVSDHEGSAEFLFSEHDPLGGSLTTRKQERGDASLQKQTVQVKRLKDYLQNHVDLLKLDVEGSEFEVLEDIKDDLAAVDRIFIEYHRGPSWTNERLERILSILRQAGIDYVIAPNRSSREAGSLFTQRNLANASLCIYGSRKN